MFTRRTLTAGLSIVVIGVAVLSVGILKLRSDSTGGGLLRSGSVSQPARPTGSDSADTDRKGANVPYSVRDDEALTALLATEEKSHGTPLSVTVINHTSREMYQYKGDTEFVMASTVKVPVLAILLLKAQRARRGLTAEEKRLAEAMIRKSDNDATTKLWKKIGSRAGFTAALPEFGLTSTVPDSGGAWGMTQTTTGDLATLLTAVADPDGPLTPANGSYILDLLSTVYDSQAWGVSAAARPGELVALKNGWLDEPEGSGNWIINSVGRITGTNAEITIAVMSHGHATMPTGITLVQKVATTTREHLSRQPSP